MSPFHSPPREEELHAFVDGQLSAGRRREIEAWLADHPEEAARIEGWRRQNRMIRELYGTVPGGSAGRIRARLSRARARQRLQRLAASLLLFAAGLGSGWLLAERIPAGVEAMADLPRQGINAYRVYVSEVRHPVEVAADQEAHLVAWLSKRLGHALRAPDLRRFGFRLMGGRLLPDGKGNPVAMLMYEDASGRRLTVLIGRPEGRPLASFRYAERGELGLFYWYDEDLGYAVVGPMERRQLLAICRAIYEQLETRPPPA